MDLKRPFAAIVASVVALVATPIAAAQGTNGGTPATSVAPLPNASTTAPPPSTPATSIPASSTTSLPPTGDPVPGSSSTTVPGANDDTTTSTTTIYEAPVPPELVDDPRLGFLRDPDANDGLDIPVAQRSFDPLSVRVLPERVAESKVALQQAMTELATATTLRDQRLARLAVLETRVTALEGANKSAVERAAIARKKLRDHAVLAYTKGRSDPTLSIVDITNVADLGVAKEYLSTLLRRQDRLVRDYEKARKSLSQQNAMLADELGVERSKSTEDQAAVDKAAESLRVAQEQLAAYEAGAHAYIGGFVFPVAAEAEFIDSWGFPRMMGTPSAHWHQGSDVFAAYGAPLVAAENGVIDRLGQASLGGNKLWVKGDSGTSYYYAHLSAFAPAMADGKRVKAGELVGYVGDTGNAKGTSPHLHFEVHPANSDVVNAYPLLKAAYGNRPMFKAVAPVLIAPAEAVPGVAAASTGPAPAGG